MGLRLSIGSHTKTAQAGNTRGRQPRDEVYSQLTRDILLPERDISLGAENLPRNPEFVPNIDRTGVGWIETREARRV
jgi:hypothetical protein